MKKLVLLLVISLGLVSAANLDAVCGEEDDLKMKAEYHIKKVADSVTNTQQKAERIYNNVLHNSMLSHYSKEFKYDDKISFCIYLNIIYTDFENEKLTQEEIEQFERYMAQRGKYDSYINNKESYMRVLKFFKYYRNAIPSYQTMGGMLHTIGKNLQDLKDYGSRVAMAKYVYGTRQGGILFEGGTFDFDKFKKDTLQDMEKCRKSPQSTEDCNITKLMWSVAQWAEPIIKQPKLKEAK